MLTEKLVDYYLIDVEMLESAARASSRMKVLACLGKAYGTEPGFQTWSTGEEVARALGWSGKDIADLRSTIQDLLEEYKEAGVLDTL